MKLIIAGIFIESIQQFSVHKNKAQLLKLLRSCVFFLGFMSLLSFLLNPAMQKSACQKQPIQVFLHTKIQYVTAINVIRPILFKSIKFRKASQLLAMSKCYFSWNATAYCAKNKNIPQRNYVQNLIGPVQKIKKDIKQAEH